MGLFSSKHKRTVHTSVVRAVDDTAMPETLRQAILRSVYQETNISEELVNGLIDGPALNFERMFRYAQKDYYWGLPNARLLTNKGGTDDVQRIIEAELGHDVTVEYCVLGAPRSQHFAWQALVDQHGYDPTTNVLGHLTDEKGTPVYLSDLVVVYPESLAGEIDPSLMESLGVPATSGYTPKRPASGLGRLGRYAQHTDYVLDPDRTEDAALVFYTYEQDGAIVDDHFELTLATLEAGDYFQALVSWDGGSDLAYRYWTYRQGAGDYPKLDNVKELAVENPGTYFPFALFRRDRTNIATKEREDTEEYQSTKTLLDFINIDYQKMGDSIAENEDAGDIDQAILMMAMPVTSEHQIDLAYVYAFFERLYRTNPSASTAGRDSSHGEKRIGSAFLIEEADSNTILSYNSISKRIRAGQIGKVGEYQKEIREEPYTVRESHWAGSNKNEVRRRIVERTYYRYSYHIRYQRNATFFEEVIVEDLVQNRRSDGRSYATNATLKDDPENILIPLDRSLADTWSLADKETLYLRSLHYVFHSMHVERVKWYQSGWFTFALKVAAVVISIYSIQAAAITLAAAASLTAIAWAVTTMVVQAIAFKLATRELVKILGADGTLLAAVALAAAAAYQGYTGSTLLPSSEQLLMASNGMLSESQLRSADLMQDLQDDLIDFQSYQKDKNEELDSAKGLLNQSNLLDPFALFDTPTVPQRFGESPDDFYERTVHSGNIGVAGIDLVSGYTDIALTLPSINTTLGGSYA
ncbi:hypothetical protein [Larsenimonas suaedae]|uniref:Uncharacterized protein n=1 Tax=Larsenimonas suaedae TaxID=1851019 RepID=A0ABU1GZ42_9GAMM|nr:hypothetical protein [Larsenimonas suaedae]MCM2973726.1 hypothetical protein [Larsenimonas suaedae]MDR5897335.1 hypothetical protein [Larsenimonas suaedae]